MIHALKSRHIIPEVNLQDTYIIFHNLLRERVENVEMLKMELCVDFVWILNYLEIFIISVSSEDVYRLASLIFETQESGVIEKFVNFKYLLSQSHCTIGNSRKSNVLHQCKELEVLVPLSTYSPEA